jgi:hypothetical protein
MTKPCRVDLAAALETVDEPGSPRIVGHYKDKEAFDTVA